MKAKWISTTYEKPPFDEDDNWHGYAKHKSCRDPEYGVWGITSFYDDVGIEWWLDLELPELPQEHVLVVNCSECDKLFPLKTLSDSFENQTHYCECPHCFKAIEFDVVFTRNAKARNERLKIWNPQPS